MRFHRKSLGFTLIEVMVAVAIFSIIAGTAFSVSASFLTDSQRISNVNLIVQHLRLAQMRAISEYRKSAWGMHLEETPVSFSIFRGSSYAVRDPAFDTVVELPSSLSFSNISLQGGGADIVFERMTGQTSNYGTFTLSDNNENDVLISVNVAGVIDSQPL